MRNPIIAKALVVALVVAAVVVIVATKRPPAAPTTEAPAPLASASAVSAAHAESAESAPSTAVGLPRLLELGSTTCIPCKQMVPVLDALRSEYGGKLTVEFIDVLADREAGERYRVEVIPTQVFFDAQGKELGRHQGYWPKEEILGQFTAYGVKLAPAPEKGAGR